MSYNSLLINTCDLITITENKWKDRTTTTENAVPCRFEWKNRVVRNFEGEQVVSSGTVFFKSGVTIDATTKIVFDGRSFAVLNIRKPANSASWHHIEVDIA